MDINRLVSFLGHSSIHDEFDDFLADNGIIPRPKPSDDYPYSIKLNEAGLSLGFEDDPEDKEMVRKSPGQFLFSEIYFDFESKKKSFAGALPFGIGGARTSADIERVLGTPRLRKDYKHPGFRISYFLEGIVLSAVFGDDDGKKIRFVRISLKDKYAVMHGLAPA